VQVRQKKEIVNTEHFKKGYDIFNCDMDHPGFAESIFPAGEKPHKILDAEGGIKGPREMQRGFFLHFGYVQYSYRL
jgi:hypothetical protein